LTNNRAIFIPLRARVTPFEFRKEIRMVGLSGWHNVDGQTDGHTGISMWRVALMNDNNVTPWLTRTDLIVSCTSATLGGSLVITRYMSWLSFSYVGISVTKELNSLTRSDGKCPDGLTLIPW